MARFEDLPLDLLPLILQHFIRPAHLANACLVNKDFYAFAIYHLYRRVFIYAWHTNVKTKVRSVRYRCTDRRAQIHYAVHQAIPYASEQSTSCEIR